MTTISKVQFQPFPQINPDAGSQTTTTLFSFFNDLTLPTSSLLVATASQVSVVNVQDLKEFVFQVSVEGTGTASVSVSSSIDGLHYVPEFEAVLSEATSSVTRLAGRRGFLQASFVPSGENAGTASVSASVYVLAGI